MRLTSVLGIVIAAGVMVGQTAIAAAACLDDKDNRAVATGVLSIGKAKDAAGRRESPYILTLKTSVCLTTDDPSDAVDASKTIHVYSSEPNINKQLASMVGKSVLVRGRPFPALTAHHHAPIVMELVEITAR